MTLEERIQTVAARGFTERQAHFLVLVMLHGGVCLGRQYCAFAGIRRGQKIQDFFSGLVRAKYATVYPRAHGQTNLYHVHAKSLYRAIGESENRHRRPVPLPRAIERLMVLDAVLADRQIDWLATERDKVRYFLRTTRLAREALPHLTFGDGPAQTQRFFPDKLPIGIDRDGRTHTFLYLVTRPVPVDFRLFLHRHADLLRALPGWTLRLLVPRHLGGAIRAYQQAARDEFGSPLRPAAVDELRWYFERRRDAGRDAAIVADARYRRAQAAFAAPRFRVLYRVWRQCGDQALHTSVSPVLADALVRRAGAVDCQVLPHGYQHLAGLVGSS